MSSMLALSDAAPARVAWECSGAVTGCSCCEVSNYDQMREINIAQCDVFRDSSGSLQVVLANKSCSHFDLLTPKSCPWALLPGPPIMPQGEPATVACR